MLTISDCIEVTLEIESITSIQEAFEENTLRCAYCAVRNVCVCVCVLGSLEEHGKVQPRTQVLFFSLLLSKNSRNISYMLYALVAFC